MKTNDIISNIIIVNGIYDVLCAITILKIVELPIIKDLHLSMLKKRDKKNGNLEERFFAYWIFTYGIVRIYSGYYKKYQLAEISYYIEALFIANECFINGTMKIYQSSFVIIFSLFLGILCEFAHL